MGDGEQQKSGDDRLLLATMLLALALVEGAQIYWRQWLGAALVPLAAAAGFFASSLTEWFRYYVLYHPREGIRRGDEAALARIDRVIGIVLGAAAVATFASSVTDWFPEMPGRVLFALFFGFMVHQHLPSRLHAPVQRMTAPPFLRLFRKRLRPREGGRT